MSDDLIKIAVLEQKFLDLKEVVLKVDDAIQKISQVNINLTKMLAVHEQKLEVREETDKSLESKIDHIYDRMEKDHNNVLIEIKKVNTTLSKVEKDLDDRLKKVEADQTKINLKFTFFAAAVVIFGFVIQNSEFFHKILSPQPLTNTNQSGRIEYRAQ